MFLNTNINTLYTKIKFPMLITTNVHFESFTKYSFSRAPILLKKKIKSILFVYIQSYKYILLKLYYIFLTTIISCKH